MVDAATPQSVTAPDGAALDELVPPPGPRSRRVTAWVVFLGLLAAVCWAWVSGTATPHLDGSSVTGYGGRGPVFVALVVNNSSRVDIELTGGPRARAGLRSIGYTRTAPDSRDPGSVDRQSVERDPFPIRIHPNTAVQLYAWFDVTDCAAIARAHGGTRAIDLQVAIADGPFAHFTRTRWIGGDRSFGPVDESSAAPANDGSAYRTWPVAATRFACATKRD